MGAILCTAHAEEKTHEFRLYEASIGGGSSGDITMQGDSGYQGILQLNQNSETPQKSPKAGNLLPVKKWKTGVSPVSASSLNISMPR
jgi:hypothetical protein